jgi:hypothetical protein
MTRSRGFHLSEESLLLFISGELPDPERRLAVDHLAWCGPCRQRLEEASSFAGEMRQAVNRADYERFSSRLDSVHRRSGWFSRVLRYSVTALSATAALIVGLLVWNSSVPPVSATELLDRAVHEDSQRAERAAYVSLRDANGACTLHPDAPVVLTGGACERIRSRLQTAHWDWQNPLSARGFERWRSSLRDKHDTVTLETSSYKLRTSTTSGVLRAATLQVRSGDFHPLTMRLEFEESALIEVSEESAPEPVTSAAIEPSAAPKPVSVTPDAPAAKPPSQELAERLDSAEIRVRVALHERQADLGYETMVRREPDALEVFGLVRSPERQAELAATLSAIPNVRVAIKTYAEFQPGDDSSFPKGEQGNTLPPLASKWLKSTWPDQDQSAAFVNRAGQLASALLGEANVWRELEVRYAALKDHPAAGELLLVRQDHEKRITTLLSSLKNSLEPLTGPLGDRTAISAAGARTLQSAVTRLFSASRADAGTLEDEIARLRAVYGAAQ